MKQSNYLIKIEVCSYNLNDITNISHCAGDFNARRIQPTQAQFGLGLARQVGPTFTCNLSHQIRREDTSF